ncbi:MAG: glycosyl hydrolase family 25 [Oscillospiraceae bacterium]|nr:glycosyl hydrolase family 25 [Oscillospiraceae bacterium]
MRWLFRLLLRMVLFMLVIAAVLVLSVALLRWRGLILMPQEAAPRQWEVFGVDVSAYQGVVDWSKLAQQGVSFAFIKATEGSSLQDRRFADNWAGATAAGVRPGAYHFFSYDSSGETQAENFIAQVPNTPGALPPVIDLEFYGPYLQAPKDRAQVQPNLDILLERLEAHYGVKPILYVTYRSYRLYLSGGAYRDYPLWFSSPVIAPLGRGWRFWQYSHSARLEGYQGEEQRIDLNVFSGSRQQFDSFGQIG